MRVSRLIAALGPPMKPFGRRTKPIPAEGKVIRKRMPSTVLDIDQTEGSIMWAINSSIYRAYCYARLLEMRSGHRRASHA
jgi:hypothetical protein